MAIKSILKPIIPSFVRDRVRHWRAKKQIILALRRSMREDTFKHACRGKPPEIPYRFIPDIVPDDEDVAIAERLVTAYHRCLLEAPQVAHDDMWSHIAQRQQDFIGILTRRDLRFLASLLCNMNKHTATEGTNQGAAYYSWLQQLPFLREGNSRRIKEGLVSLAEAMAVVTCENPEQGPWGDGIHADIDELVGKIEACLGIDITPPPIDGGLLKIVSARGSFCERDVNAIYAAWRLREICDTLPAPSLCEIGGGNGRTTYWAHRLGFKRCALYDLPHINVLQGYYLIKSLPRADIKLYGETVKGTPEIAILPDFAIAQANEVTYDVVLNQDSFPEIAREIVERYLAWIPNVSAGHFYSINQECGAVSSTGMPQLNVASMLASNTNYKKLWRYPYWIRPGYVEELYAIN